MAIFWWAGTLTARQLAESLVFSRLAQDGASVHAAHFSQAPSQAASSALSSATAAATGPAQRDERFQLYPEYDQPSSDRLYLIRDEQGLILTSLSAIEHEPTSVMLAPGESRRGRWQTGTGHRFLYWSGGFSRHGRAVTVVVYNELSPLYRRLDLAAWYVAGASVLLLLTLLSVQRVILRRTTQRLDAIRADVERLGHGEIVSLPEDVPEEVRPLVVEFNQLLSRFDHRLRQSRNAVGNLAHALKGPLNLMIRAADNSAGERGVQQNAERIRQLIDGELRRARLVGRTSVGRRFDLAAEVETLSGLLAQVYADKTVDVRLAEGAGVEIVHDRQDMLELIGNLLDNAVKWAESLVMVNARYANGLLLEIEDDGPGVSADELARLTERGVRLDETVDGHGLGLSIVRDIVAIYGGELELGRSVRLGGFRVSVRLPETLHSR